MMMIILSLSLSLGSSGLANEDIQFLSLDSTPYLIRKASFHRLLVTHLFFFVTNQISKVAE